VPHFPGKGISIPKTAMFIDSEIVDNLVVDFSLALKAKLFKIKFLNKLIS
jgi:hypothetical protein